MWPPAAASALAYRRPSHPPPLSTATPQYAPTFVDSPVVRSFSPDPMTPTSRRRGSTGLSPVDENASSSVEQVVENHANVMGSGGSRAPLVSRDYAVNGNGNGMGSGRGKNYPYPSRVTPIDGLGPGANNPNPSSTSFIPIEEVSEASFPLAPPRKPLQTSSLEPLLIPPPSIHDRYLASFLDPLKPSSTPSSPRPGATRSASTPAVPISSAPTSGTSTRNPLLPSPAVDSASTQPKTVFEIFDAELSEGAEGMVKALKGHLEEVLRAQEEVGRMHLELEGLGDKWLGPMIGEHNSPNLPKSPKSPKQTQAEKEKGDEGGNQANGNLDDDDALLRREKGVDALMERLGSLSEKLRTYHSLGTPKLAFPNSTKTPLAPFINRPHGSSPFDSPSGEGPGDIHYRQDPSASAMSPRHQAATPAGLGLGSPSNFPHPLPRGVESLRQEEGFPPRHPLQPQPSPAAGTTRSSRSTSISKHQQQQQQDQRQPPHPHPHPHHNGEKARPDSQNSDLPPLSLSADDEYNSNSNSHNGFLSMASPLRKKTSASFYDLEGLRREREEKERNGDRDKGQERWLEHLSPPQRSTGKMGASVDSPIEMVDRSRPW